jgi:hypothetical protein
MRNKASKLQLWTSDLVMQILSKAYLKTNQSPSYTVAAIFIRVQVPFRGSTLSVRCQDTKPEESS